MILGSEVARKLSYLFKYESIPTLSLSLWFFVCVFNKLYWKMVFFYFMDSLWIQMIRFSVFTNQLFQLMSSFNKCWDNYVLESKYCRRQQRQILQFSNFQWTLLILSFIIFFNFVYLNSTFDVQKTYGKDLLVIRKSLIHFIWFSIILRYTSFMSAFKMKIQLKFGLIFLLAHFVNTLGKFFELRTINSLINIKNRTIFVLLQIRIQLSE